MSLKTVLVAIISDRYFETVKQLFFKVRSILFIGSKVSCPICRGNFRKFLTFGIERRVNARCPKCGSLERHRLLWIYLRDRTNLFTERMRVLDVAPLFPLQKKLKEQQNLVYISVDVASPLAMTKMDIREIAFRKDSFDAIICYHVLEHIPEDHQVLSELHRILKPKGWAILQSPVDYQRDDTFEAPDVLDPKERLKLFGQRDHVRIYGKDYVDRLKNAGFIVVPDKFAAELGDETNLKYGLNRDEIIYFTHKPNS